MDPSDPKPTAHVHVDLDGLWTLAQGYGFPEKDLFERDPVFEKGIERLLDLFGRAGVGATFFIVGRDLELAAKREAVRRIAAAHELANHSYNHRMDLELASDEEQADDLQRAGRAIGAVAGTWPISFRAPGYAAGPRLLRALMKAGLRYDGSRLPTPWAPLLRWMAGRLRGRVAREVGSDARPVAGAAQQYGDGGGAPVLEMFSDDTLPGHPTLFRRPLFVSPRLGLPMQASMAILLGRKRTVAAMRQAAQGDRQIVWLLHGMDVLGPEDIAGRLPETLLRERAFRIPLKERMEYLEGVLTDLKGIAQVLPRQDEALGIKAPPFGDASSGQDSA